MTHRYFAGSLGLMIALLAARSWRHRRDPGQPVKLPLFILAVVLAQAAFGMWTVTLKLWAAVTGHLLGGFATLRPAVSADPAAVRRTASVGRAQAPAILGNGGAGAGDPADRPGRLGQFNYAAVACVDLPTCHGQWWPAADFANGFHLTQHIGPNYLGPARQ